MANIKKIKIGDVTYDIMIDDKYIFKYIHLGQDSSQSKNMENFTNKLNTLSGLSEVGFYRIVANNQTVAEVHNIQLSSSDKHIMQILKGPFKINSTNGLINIDANNYITAYRNCLKGVWNEWTTINTNSSGEIDNNIIVWGSNSNLNNFTTQGEYSISGTRQNANDNMPITNNGNIEGKLDVMSNNNVISQTLTLLNVNGGDGNVYTRTKQNNQWKPWGKLQTNIEVGMVNQTQMDNLVDNGIYSGIFQNDGNLETFVLIVINNYAVAEAIGDKGKQSICQLKYGLSLYDSVGNLGGVTLQTRKRDAFGFWGAWKPIYNMNNN